MHRALLQRSQKLVLWLGFVPAVLSVTAYFISSRHVESVREGRAITELISATHDLLANARDAESGQRGYLLTGDRAYLKPYERARRLYTEQVTAFERLSQAQGVPASEYSRIRPLLVDKMNELAETVRLRDSQGFAGALRVVETGRGRADMELLRSTTASLIARQEQRFGSSLLMEDRREKILEVVLALGVLLSFYLVLFAYKSSSLYARERDEVDAHIRQTVEQRTRELSERTKELEARSAELQRSNADLLQFAYIASHDLQEPLRTVASYVGLLAKRYQGQLDENADRYIRFAVEGATRMQTLISDLLLYSRVGTQAAEPSVVDVNCVLKVVVENLQVAIVESGANIEATSLPVVIADEKRLVQVFQNLISNSIKFRKPDVSPVIRVGCRSEGDFWIMTITDNGIGFDQKFADRIFQVFQRLHSVGSHPGNGIGLAVVRRIIEQQGGTLWAESQPGYGSTFSFSLPGTKEALTVPATNK